ncbi:hypothetical protein [Tatumella sp. UBA2305]|uniref:hypothetical protein n=1 Tax=Tatumella sp. UBA2305 TaxID=1947647 RepID=UPI0025DF8702|nr:hypothetical protein [Tatumella sp. UBA2305]
MADTARKYISLLLQAAGIIGLSVTGYVIRMTVLPLRCVALTLLVRLPPAIPFMACSV